MTDQELAAIRAENAERRKRKEAAGPGPWTHGDLVVIFTAAASDPVEDRIDALLAEVQRLRIGNRSLCELLTFEQKEVERLRADNAKMVNDWQASMVVKNGEIAGLKSEVERLQKLADKAFGEGRWA